MYYPTQYDINLMKQTTNQFLVQVDILDLNFKTINTIKGTLLSDNGSFDVDSEIRKSMSLTFIVKNNQIPFGSTNVLWLNKFVHVTFLKLDNILNQYVTYDRGIYVLSNYSIEYSSNAYTFSLECSDMVSLYNGDISGTLKGLKTKILIKDLQTSKEDKVSVRQAMLAVMELAHITKYSIGDMSKELPSDLEFTTSQTIWDMVVKVRDLYPGWETFFDFDGTFVCQEIPTCENDSISLDSEFWKPLIIDEHITCDLFSVKNATKIWGKCLECDYFAEEKVTGTNPYVASFKNLPIESDGRLSYGIKLAITIPSNNLNNAQIKIRNIVDGKATPIGVFDIVDDLEQPIKKDTLKAQTTYIFRFRRNKLFFMGQWQIVSCCYLVATEPTSEIKKADELREGTSNLQYVVNPDSPFCREYIGERMQVLSGGNYDDIYSQQLAKERAEYENWKSSRTNYNLSLKSIFVPFVFGNNKIEYRLKSTNEKKDWIVKKISGSWLEGTMSITLSEFYPLYPFIVQKK